MKKVYLESVELGNYRNFADLSLDFAQGMNIIKGPNGCGKTNILESVSFLSPGKGLKSANFDDICKFTHNSWSSNFHLQSKMGRAEISTSFSENERSRKINYNGSKLSGSELTNLLNVIWLTPQMEGLFLGGASARRRFLDRIVYNFDAKHAKNLKAYEHFMRQRNQALLQGDIYEQASWLTKLEEHMAIEASAIDASRREVAFLMQESIDKLETEFPKAQLEVMKLVENQQDTEGFLEYYTGALAASRKKDSYSGRTSFGVHKSDLLVFHKAHNAPAALCSTGEQKALLISIMLASIAALLENSNTTPILLLDELFIHLDEERKKHLSEYITSSKLQTFITTTDIVGIEDLAKNAHIIDL
ncbi:MAG: DNA replication/repair protein RecF [Rickettsiales bacterium]|nr:MAG: DNA replication/repair protein RecF [Rickettsiales bacterium]